MEKKNSYNLYHKSKDFISLLKLNNFVYNDAGNIISKLNGGDYYVGRILESKPPYLIIHDPPKSTKEQKKVKSRLVKLANEFEIN